MESWILLFMVILFGTFYQECTAKTHFKYMTNYCSETVTVTASMVVALTPSEVLQAERGSDYFHCSVDLMAAEGRRLYIHFLHLSISSNARHTDRLKLYDIVPGRTRIPITPPQGVYGMLDRSLMTSDKSGSKVGEFSSKGRTMQVEYLGKPTQTHSGFRMLVTTIADKDSKGECPQSMFNCPKQAWCIPSILACDRLPNCGEHDLADEDACNLNDLVSTVSYSLTEDILLIVFLPLLIFILGVVVVVITTRWHVNKKYPPPVPSVKYTNEGDGEIDLEGSDTIHLREAPPSYTEALAHAQRSKRFAAKPPSYNMLEDLEREGIIVDSEDDENIHQPLQHHHHHHHHHHHTNQHQPEEDQLRGEHPNQHFSPLSRGHRVQERWSRDILTTSNSSIENTDDSRSCGNNSRPAPRKHAHHHHHPHHQQQQQQQRPRRVSPRPIDLDCSFSEDEETKRKARRKGGKCKSKVKRRADDLCNVELNPIESVDSIQRTTQSPNAQNLQERSVPSSVPTSLPHSTSSSLVTSPLNSPSSTNSNISVPSPSSATSSSTPSLSAVSSFTALARRNQKHSTIAENTSCVNLTDVKPVAVLPLSSSTVVGVRNGPSNSGSEQGQYNLYQKETALNSSDLSMSSGPEADKNNISETESVVLSMADENNGKTESCASSSNSQDGGEFIIKDPKSLKSRNSNNVEKKSDSAKSLNKVTRKIGKCKKREVKQKNNADSKVTFGLSPLDIEVNRCSEKLGDEGELCEDADVSSDSDAGVEVDLRRQQIVSTNNKKKCVTKA